MHCSLLKQYTVQYSVGRSSSIQELKSFSSFYVHLTVPIIGTFGIQYILYKICILHLLLQVLLCNIYMLLCKSTAEHRGEWLTLLLHIREGQVKIQPGDRVP